MTKVMVVDDEPDLRKMISIMISNEGFETETASDKQSILEKINSFNPEILIIASTMRKITADIFLENFNENKNRPKSILLTSERFSEEEKKELFNKMNVVDYIKKPFDLDDLMDAVKKHVGSI